MIQHPPGMAGQAPASAPARTHRLAVLAPVLAVVVPPVGIVLGALVLRQTRQRQDRRLAIGALLVAFVVLVGETLLLMQVTAGPPAGSAPAAAGTGAGTSTAAAGSAAPDPQGVVKACGTVLPAIGQVRAEAGKVRSADQYGEALIQLANTIVTAAGATTDPTFLDDVGQLSQAFQKGWQDSSNGTAPSAVADELTAAGAPVARDCTAAGYHP